MSKKDNPRWLHEIPGIINTGEKKELTEEEKKEAKEFEKAVISGEIDKWFNKK